MGYEIPTTEPDILVEGMSWEWDRALDDFTPADGWTLRYAFTGPGTVLTLIAAASADGTTHEIRRGYGDTGGLTPGRYEMAGWVDDGSNRHEVYRAAVVIQANLDTDTDARSHDEKVLSAINAMIEGRTGTDLTAAKRVTVNGRTLEQHSADELVRLQGTYRARVWMARHPGKIGHPVAVVYP